MTSQDYINIGFAIVIIIAIIAIISVLRIPSEHFYEDKKVMTENCKLNQEEFKGIITLNKFIKDKKVEINNDNKSETKTKTN